LFVPSFQAEIEDWISASVGDGVFQVQDCKAKWVKWVSLQPVRAYGGLVPYLLVNVPMSCPVLFPSGAPLARLRIYLASRDSNRKGVGLVLACWVVTSSFKVRL
jgi:hypothetical protein